METKIKAHIDDAAGLEQLYQSDKKGFEKSFSAIYPEIANSPMAQYWKARLDYPGITRHNVQKSDVYLLILSCLFTAFLIKMPQLFGFNPDKIFYFERNAGLIVLFGLSAYSIVSRMPVHIPRMLASLVIFALSAIYINLLPMSKDSNSIRLAYIHLPLFLWCIYGLIFIRFDTGDLTKRIDYIRYNGDLAILVAIILITGGILTGVTVGLFSAIGLKIERFYFDYIVLSGLVSSPIVATYIVRNFPSVSNKIAPIIAHIFSPLVLITLTIYLISIALTGKDPYSDRDFLMVFNIMLIGVMAIIVFSVAGTSSGKKKGFNELILFALTLVTLIIDIVALSAIVFRLGEYGFTPNRIAVLGSNLLIFGNLVLLMIDLYKVGFRGKDIHLVEQTIARYLPLYSAWTIVVTFVLPFIFKMK